MERTARRMWDAGDRIVLAWIVAVFGITALGMLPLYVYRVDLSKLTFSSSIMVWGSLMRASPRGQRLVGTGAARGVEESGANGTSIVSSILARRCEDGY